MKLFSQDLIEKIVLDVLVDLSKQEGVPKEVASQSMDILNDPIDNAVFSGVIISKIRPSVFSEKEELIRLAMLQLLQLGHDYFIDENDGSIDFSSELLKEFKYEDIDSIAYSTKMNYALSQFIFSFCQYERLQKKYPELIKCL
jgi:hypothetical protein